MASQLHVKLQVEIEFTAVASERNYLITYMTLLYKRAVLEGKVRNDGRSVNNMEYTMEIMSADSDFSNQARRAFIELGGIKQFSYKFQGGEKFLDITVDKF